MKTKINSLCRPAGAVTGCRAGKLVACLILGVATLAQTARSAPALVGQWLTNSSLADVSGYSPAGTHDGYDIVGTGNFVFTNDVPPGKQGMSLFLWNGDTGIAISNSATVDGTTYTNTYDDQITNAFTVSCWAKGFPASWSPFVSKWGEGAPYNTPSGGWQLRADGNDNYSCFTVRDTNSGALVFGNSGDALDDLATTTQPSNDGGWHFYTGVFSAITGVRSLYVDSVLAAQETGNIPYFLTPNVHVCIGAKENPNDNTFGNFSIMEVYDVRIYNYDLTAAQVSGLYGVVAAVINGQPQSISTFTNQAARFSATVGGTAPIKYQWQLNNANIQSLPDAANFTGANSNVLTVLNVSPADAGSYRLIASNVILGVTYTVASSNALLTIVPKTLVGEWFTNGTLTDLSHYTPAGTHDGYAVGNQTYDFSNSVPSLWPGLSLALTTGDTAIAISNSATGDMAYTNTFDDNAFTVAFWAQGNQNTTASQWTQWVSKDGYENNGYSNDGLGWSVGTEGWSHHLYFEMEGIDHGGITTLLGDGLWGNQILETYPQALPPDATTWHHYAATYSVVTGVRDVYYDGVIVAQQDHLGAYNPATLEHLLIGGMEQKNGSDSAFINSLIYDVRFYNYDLTGDQVLYLLAPASAPPVITAQPASTYGNAGKTTQFSVSVNGGRPLAYQWQVSTDGGAHYSNVNDVNVSGATSANVANAKLVFNNLQASEAGLYRLVITNANGATNSLPVQLTVVPSAQPVYAWQAPVSITGLTAEQILDQVPGTFFEAEGAWPFYGYTVTTLSNNVYFFDGRGLSATVAGQSGDVWWVGPFGGNSTGNSVMDNVLAAAYTDGGVHEITMHNLTPGLQYSVQLIGLDDRTDSPPESARQSNYQDLNNSSDVSATFAMGDNVYVIGTFTAIYPDMTVQQNLLTGGNGNIQAAIVRTLTPVFSGGAPAITTSPDGQPQLVLTYTGTLLSATNAAGPYLPVADATSPYTNNISAAPRMFFKLIGP